MSEIQAELTNGESSELVRIIIDVLQCDFACRLANTILRRNWRRYFDDGENSEGYLLHSTVINNFHTVEIDDLKGVHFNTRSVVE